MNICAVKWKQKNLKKVKRVTFKLDWRKSCSVHLSFRVCKTFKIKFIPCWWSKDSILCSAREPTFLQLFLQLYILDFQRSFSPREEAFVPDMCIDLIGEMTCMHKRFTARRLHWTNQWKQTEMLSGFYFWINKQIPSNVSATIDARNISRRLTVVNLLFTNLAIVDSFLRNMWVRIDFSCPLHTKLIYHAFSTICTVSNTVLVEPNKKLIQQKLKRLLKIGQCFSKL